MPHPGHVYAYKFAIDICEGSSLNDENPFRGQNAIFKYLKFLIRNGLMIKIKRHALIKISKGRDDDFHTWERVS